MFKVMNTLLFKIDSIALFYYVNVQAIKTMKPFFLFLFCLWISLFPNQLIAYSSISEYNSDSSASHYSSIGCYPNNEVINEESEAPAEYKNTSVDINIETDYENRASNENASEFIGESPIMMATGPLTYNGQVKLDDDGTGPSHGDHDHKEDTSFHRNNKALNADTDSYVVAPLWLIALGVQKGDRADVTVYFYEYNSSLDANGNLVTYPCNKFTRSISSIVGDFGPVKDDVGEISIKAARDLGLGIRERSNGLGPVPTDPHDQVNQNRDIYATVTYYPSGQKW